MATMTKSLFRTILGLTVGSVLIVAACSSEPVSLISAESDEAELSADTDEATAVDGVNSDETDRRLIGRTAISRYLIEGTLWSEAELSSLRGTVWVLFQWRDELIDDAGVSFSWVEEQGLLMSYRDECTSGVAVATGEAGRNGWLLSNVDAPDVVCPDTPASIFRDGANFSVNYRSGILTFEATNGYFRAEHSQSTSVHDAPLDLDLDEISKIVVPLVQKSGLVRPDVEPLAELNTVADLPIPECASSGRAGIEPNPRLRERLAWADALSDSLRDLPFVSHYSGGASLHNQELTIGFSVRYAPSLGWLAENVPPGIVCIEVPPLGYYNRVVADLAWTLPEGTEVDPDATSVEVVGRDCGMESHSGPEISYSPDEIEIRFAGRHVEFGVPIPSIPCAPTVLVEFDEPIGNRALVPRFTS
jgi:hypothetical protein